MFGANPAPHDPPGAGASKCAPGESLHELKARGGSGGTARGKLGAHYESEHAHHTTRAHNEPCARYNWAARGARRLRETTQAENPGRRKARTPADLRAATTKVRGSGGHLFPPQSEQSAFARVPPGVAAGCGAYSTSEAEARRDPGATDPRDTRGRPRKAPDHVWIISHFTG